MTSPLSETHRRGISATLSLLDEMLCRFERWANGELAEGVLYRERDTLTSQQRKTIFQEIAALRSLMTELRDRLGLKVTSRDIGIAIWSESSAYWEALVELGPKYLRRYGDMPDDFARDFDGQVETIIRHMNRIAEAASRQPPRPH